MGRHSIGHRPLGYIVLLNSKGEPDMKYKVNDKGKVICINGPEMKPCPGYDITNATRSWRKELKARSLPPPPLPKEKQIPNQVQQTFHPIRPLSPQQVFHQQMPKYNVNVPVVHPIPHYPIFYNPTPYNFIPNMIVIQPQQKPVMKQLPLCCSNHEQETEIFTMKEPMEVSDFLNLMKKNQPIIQTQL